MILSRYNHLITEIQALALLLLMSIFSCITASAAPQEGIDVSNQFRFEHLSATDGMVSQRVFSIVEGSDHAIWIATKSGIQRYNGVTMQYYNLDLNVTSYSELTSRIFRLYKAGDGNLYAFSNSGKIFRYDVVSNSFVVCLDLTKVFSQQLILNDICIKDNKWWLALNLGLYRCGQGGKPVPVINNAFVNDIMEANDGLSVGTNSGLFYINRSTSKPTLLFPNLQVQTSYYDEPNHFLCIGTFDSGLMLGDPKTRKLYPATPDIPHKPVRAITPLNAETMLVGVDGGGVAGISRRTGKVRFHLSTDDETGSVLHGNGIYAICRDEWGNIWIGSYSGGVDIAYAKDNAMRIVSHEFLNPQSLFNNNVNDILDDGNGNIYYATDRGVSIFHKSSNSWTHTMQRMVCLNFARDPGGRILVGTYGGGVKTIDGADAYTKENGKLKTDYVYSLYNDGRGNLWIGCLDGDLACVSASGERYFPIQNVQSISGMPDGRVVIATANGFYAIDAKGTVSHYFTYGELPSIDVNTYIVSVLFTSSTEAWLGTDGGGVYIYNLRLHSLRQLTVDDGLPSNSVKAIMRDSLGRIWITTDHGMVCVTAKPKIKVVAVDLPYGGGLEFNRGAAAILDDGLLAFGSTSGALIIKPDAILATSFKAPIQLLDIKVSGLDADEASALRPHIYKMLSKGKVELPYSQNTFTLSFESINLKYQYDIKYQYFIEGKQDNAMQTVDDGQILFNSLAPGTYRIHLRSVSRSTGQLISERVVEIHVDHPWYSTVWAWLFYIIVIAAIAYFVWRFYRTRLDKEYEAERIDFFVNTAHDIRTPLSLTLAPLNDIAQDNTLSKETRNYLDIARRNGKQLMTLITTLLDFQKIDTRKVQLQIVQLDLRTLFEHACSRFHLLSEQKHLTLTLAECPEGATVWMDEKAANRILDNLISNSIKYTRENGKIEVGAKADDQHIIIYVPDNGIGIPEKSKGKIFSTFYRAENAVRSRITGTGLGLSLVRKLVVMQKGSVSFESKEGEGTTFFITMPKGFPVTDAQGKSDETGSTDNADSQSVTADGADQGNDYDRPTLLFVDDNAELRNYMQLTFGKSYTVVTKPDAQSALDYLSSATCDIIISDVMMPGMQGDEFCRRVKEDEATSFIPVILLTAKVGKDYTINGLNCGADDYISKPFDTAVLEAKVESILRNRMAIRKYYLRRATELVRELPQEVKSEDANAGTNAGITAVVDEQSSAMVNESDKEFVDKATEIVRESMHDESFDINALCREMAMSRTLFYNRLKALTGKTPQDFIRIMRLERAAKLLDEGASVLEASTDTGFVNVKYFSTLFKKHFGVSPSKYHKE